MRVFIEDGNTFATFATIDESEFLRDYQQFPVRVEEYGKVVNDFLNKYPMFRYCGSIFIHINGIKWLATHGVIKFNNTSIKPSMWDD